MKIKLQPFLASSSIYGEKVSNSKRRVLRPERADRSLFTSSMKSMNKISSGWTALSRMEKGRFMCPRGSLFAGYVQPLWHEILKKVDGVSPPSFGSTRTVGNIVAQVADFEGPSRPVEEKLRRGTKYTWNHQQNRPLIRTRSNSRINWI